MGRRAKLATLQDYEQNRAHNGNKVEWQIHEVTDYGFRREPGEGFPHDLAELTHRIAAGADLTLGRDKGRLISGEERLHHH